MKRVVLVAAAVTASLLGSLPGAYAAPASSPADGPAPATAALRQYYPDVDYITCEINKERDNSGLPRLAISERANDAARRHAQDMANMGKLTATGSDGRRQRDRLNDAGIFSNYIAEYMFSGYSHDGAFADMATDPRPNNGFYRALMSRDIVALGIGYDRTFWDVNLLGYHRRLVTRPAVCTQG